MVKCKLTVKGGISIYHSITFGTKNTWDDWHLVPTSRPVVNPPAQKVKTLEIPGGDGLIDLSTSLTGYPVYQNRTGSFEFLVMNDYKPWQQAYTDIMDYLHGFTMQMVLEDDPDYYYTGRFAVNAWKSEQNWSKIVIDYSVGPYKWSKTTSSSWSASQFDSSAKAGVYDGLFDSSGNRVLDSSSSGIETLSYAGMNVFRNISLTTYHKQIILDSAMVSRAPVSPVFTVTSTVVDAVQLQFVNPTLGIDITRKLSRGTTQDASLLFVGNQGATIYLWCTSGTGTVTIDFRQGRL